MGDKRAFGYSVGEKYNKDHRLFRTANNGGPIRVDRHLGDETGSRFKDYDAKKWEATHPSYLADYFPYEPERDQRMMMKAHLAQTKILGDVSVTEEDYRYFEDKKADLQGALVTRSVEECVRRKTPEDVARFIAMMPGWLESRRAIVDGRTEFMKSLASLEFYAPGPDNPHGWDMTKFVIFVYEAVNGLIEIPVTIGELLTGTAGQQVDEKEFIHGNFSVVNYIDKGVVRLAARNQAYLANLPVLNVHMKTLIDSTLANADKFATLFGPDSNLAFYRQFGMDSTMFNHIRDFGENGLLFNNLANEGIRKAPPVRKVAAQAQAPGGGGIINGAIQGVNNVFQGAANVVGQALGVNA